MKVKIKNTVAKLHKLGIAPVDDVAFNKLTAKEKEKVQAVEKNLPDDAIQYMIRTTVERNFLSEPTDGIKFSPEKFAKEQGWSRISRLPISPLDEKEYAMFPRWQNAIATMHNLQHRLCYVMLRKDGETQLYLGAIPTVPGKKGKDAGAQLAQAVSAQMPGIGIAEETSSVAMHLGSFDCCGAVTGIPSVRKITEYGEYQTMDQIAMGLRSSNRSEQDFAVVVVADPVSDAQIVEILRAMENVGSEIHALTQYTKTDGTNTATTISVANSDGVNANVNVGASLGEIVEAGVSAGAFFSTSTVKASNVGVSDSVSVQYINKSAMYCEALIDKHIERMKKGRNLGFWKTGVYVLSDSDENVNTVMGMLRAVYSGDDSYIEPIRTSLMPAGCGAAGVVQRFQYLPCRCQPVAALFGSLFEDYTTPMTTEELSIATSLPRRDVPGLRLIRNASRFTTNPPEIKTEKNGGKPVRLGEVLDTGAPTHQAYNLDLNQLVRHAMVAGSNGSGKTNTCKAIFNNVQKAKVPFLVIEPAKDEYLEWAIQENKRRAKRGEKKIRIFAPGYFGNLGITLNQKKEILDLLKAFNNLSDKEKKWVPAQARHRLNILLEELETLSRQKMPKAALNKSVKKGDEEGVNFAAIQRFVEKANRIGDIENLQLNLFQPTVMKGTWINIMTHLDRIKSALVSSMPMSDVLPLIMTDTLFAHVQDWLVVKDYSMNDETNPLKDVYRDDGTLQYPLVEKMEETAHAIIGDRNYADDVKNNLKAAMSTRVNALTLGWKKDLFNVARSTDLAELFETDAVINLSHLTDDADKALVMSVLLIALWEYRESRYNIDRDYKKKADSNQLMHLTLIEEAHRLMPDVREDGSGMNSQLVTAKMFSHMLSEIRAYGEGCVVVDQVPTRLIPDAIKNTNLKIIHRLTAADDIQAVSTSMRLRPDQQAVIGALQPGEAIVCSDFDDAAAWVQVDPVPKY